MNREGWRHVEEVYHDVVSCPPERRMAVLDQSCSGDAELRGMVESLLGARESAGNFLSPEKLADYLAELRPEVSAAVGSTIGNYDILAAIGAGAMGEVYRARDLRLGREVALKILSEQLTKDPARVVRFQLEAKAASSLNHANIVTIYEIGQAAETWFIATELIEGVTLRERLSQDKLTLEEAREIAIQCAAALAAAHRAGIIHRDIKPENIMVRPDGVAKIVDFGLARILEPRPDWVVEATQSGSVMGTPRYMSPEQARGQKLDATTDIFSLGAVLYEMATGRPAFLGTSTAEVFAALLDSAPRAPSECVKGIPPKLDVIVSKALAKDRKIRYQTMQDFVTDLQNLQHPWQTDSAISTSDRQSSKRSGAPALSRRSIIITGAGTAAALAFTWYERVNKNGNDRDARTPTVIPLTTFAGFKGFRVLFS